MAVTKFSETEKLILESLYANPDSKLGTADLMKVVKPEQSTEEQQQQAYKETQYAIETLVAENLAKGKLHAGFGDVCYAELRLTAKGEAEAINQRRLNTTPVLTITDEEFEALNLLPDSEPPKT